MILAVCIQLKGNCISKLKGKCRLNPGNCSCLSNLLRMPTDQPPGKISQPTREQKLNSFIFSTVCKQCFTNHIPPV